MKVQTIRVLSLISNVLKSKSINSQILSHIHASKSIIIQSLSFIIMSNVLKFQFSTKNTIGILLAIIFFIIEY